MAPSLSVLVCTRDRPDKAERALASILANSFTDYELIVVDQSGDHATAQAVDRLADPRLRYIDTDTVGLARSRNIAVRAARAETVVFTDDDCVCDPQWLGSIVAEYAREPELMGVFGRVLPYGGERAGMFCPATIDLTERRVIDRPAVPQQLLGHGNNMSFRMALFRRIGLFIESLGAGTPMKAGEDTELVYRGLRRHLRFAYSPVPLVHHDNWMSLDQFAVLMQASILGGTAVFTEFSLKLDRSAARHLMRTGYYVLRNRIGAGSTAKGLASFSAGMLRGTGYLFTSPPKLDGPTARPAAAE